jgi:hypothetical protein
MTDTPLYDGYFDDAGAWIAIAPYWSDIEEAPRSRAWRLWDDDGVTRLGRWGVHPATGVEMWISAIDPWLELRPRYFRDLVMPPHMVERVSDPWFLRAAPHAT